MATIKPAALTLLGLFLLPVNGHAQGVHIEAVEVGFPGLAEGQPRLFKTGLWAPVFVTIRTDDGGHAAQGQLWIEGTDADGARNAYPSPFALGPGGRTLAVGYTMPAATRPELTLTVVPEGRNRPRLQVPVEGFTALGLQSHLYLVLGGSPADLQTALTDLAGPLGTANMGLRHAAHVSAVERLPDEWFGYQAIDWAVLLTTNGRFLMELEQEAVRMEALARWVRRGGRLLVSVGRQNQGAVHKLLTHRAWEPALSPMMTPDRRIRLTSLASVQNWAAVLNKSFPSLRDRPLEVPALTAGGDREVLIRAEPGPLLVRVPHGLGSVTVLALDLDAPPFTAWTGRVDFWKALLSRLAPRVPGGRGGSGDDIGSDLERELDDFDVPAFSFGWIALLILLYVLLAGPVDHLVLRRVFKRLEWTWITFPAIVAVVSVSALFGLRAGKGRTLMVNQADLLDIDQRSDVDELGRTRTAQLFGTSWFTIFSPQNDRYAIDLQVSGEALRGWPAARPARVMTTWLGRPEVGPSGFGRPRTQTLFTGPYKYRPRAGALYEVPIPIWSSKAFQSHWEVALARPVVQADLFYRPADPNRRLAGTICSQLPVALRDVYLFYGNKAYRLAGEIDGAPVTIRLDPARAIDADRWGRPLPGEPGAEPSAGPPTHPYEPLSLVRQLLFHEYLGGNNHSFRPLDQGWRLRDWQPRDEGVRDAILVGRLERAERRFGVEGPRPGASPASVWLHDLADESRGGSSGRSGSVRQDVYVRVFLPVRPQ